MSKRTKKRPARRAKPSTKPAKKTTALARRPKVLTAELVPANGATDRVVSVGFRLDTFGLVELKATNAEEKVLAREPRADDVLIKPTGQPYIPHAVYTKWLNEAFGRGSWQLVAVGLPALAEKSVVCPYILYVHTRPIAMGHGEQEYFPTNRDQTYGDALESTYASALRRCCKHLGIGIELWDRAWLSAWKSKNAVQVRVEVSRKQDDGSWKKTEAVQWRRKLDEPLKGELGTRNATRKESSVEHADIDKSISEPKRDRFWKIARRMGRNEADIKHWLKTHYQIDRTDQITNRHYDKIVTVLERPGDLPNGHEPGEEIMGGV